MSSGVTTPVNSVVIAATAGLVIPASNQTVINQTINGASNGDAIYAIPAGKTFYLLGFTVGNKSNAAGTATIYNGAGTSDFNVNLMEYGNVTVSGGAIMGLSIPGNVIRIAHSLGATNATVAIWGFLQ